MASVVGLLRTVVSGLNGVRYGLDGVRWVGVFFFLLDGIMTDNWIEKANKRMVEKGNQGAFTRQAHRAGFKDVKAFANYVLKNQSKFKLKTVQRARFAKTMSSFS